MRIAIVIAAAVLLAACAKDDDMRQTEQKAIESYLNSASGYASELPCDSLGGVWRVLENDREGRTSGAKIEKGSEIDFIFEGYPFYSALDLSPTSTSHPAPFYTNNNAIIESLGVDWPTAPRTAKVGGGQLVGGLDAGLMDAYKGDSLLIFMLSERGYGKDAMGSVPENTSLVFRIVINEVR